MQLRKIHLLILLFCLPNFLFSQEIDLFQQFSGRYDYVAFGNTLNRAENGAGGDCTINTQSSAEFVLEPNQTIVAAYLYWAGSGEEGDLEVTFNGIDITAERDFTYALPGTELVYFSAFADVTDILLASGPDTYILSDLDLTDIIEQFCGNATNFGGWAVTVIYEDEVLPLNQVNIFDGLESVSLQNPTLAIELNSLQLVDNSEAKIGFLSWEGDRGIANNETLRLNGTILSNPPLNPSDNAFNGTNTFTNDDQLFNMDIDVYAIQNLIQPGDETALIELTSNQDLVLINNIVTVLNTALPDGTIVINDTTGGDECGNREITVDYTVSNVNGTDRLPIGTSIGFYADNTLIDQTQTTDIILVGETESGTITLTVPETVPAEFLLRAIVDDTLEVNELDDSNNEDNLDFRLLLFPDISGLSDITICDVAGVETFNLTEATTTIDDENTISFHLNETDAENNDNEITDIETYENTSNPQDIWVRVANPDCFITASFAIEIIECPLPDATVEIDNEIFACRERDLTIEYTVYNTTGTDILPANTPISFYIETVLVAQSQTVNDIPIGGSESGSVTLTLADNVPDNFLLVASVDDTGTGIGIVEELDEGNNTFDVLEEFGTIPPIAALPNLLECDEGFNTTFFDLTEQNEIVFESAQGIITYHTSMDDALESVNAISDPEQYQNTSDPQTIYVRLENEICFATASFLLTTENCPPFIPDGISPNGDTVNDVFEITGLLNVFENFSLKMYSRNGNLIYEGGNEEGFWDGIPNTGLLNPGSIVPTGTYYYVLQLNDPEYPEPLLGWIYVNY